MNVCDFINTIYLGDRAVKSVWIDCWGKEVKVEIDCISRIRGKKWNFYIDEDVVNGRLVFFDVCYVSFGSSGLVPNDYIDDLCAVEDEGGGYLIKLTAGFLGDELHHKDAVMEIKAKSMAIEDPLRPGQYIIA
ncbi:DUF6258 family protein [Chitiniphilus shinanonensis]|uniref:DUF6258 family protein n=1 Tax=Chitiniphilus shinanonensis TaxID=553088 RepID=UPI003027987F